MRIASALSAAECLAFALLRRPVASVAGPGFTLEAVTRPSSLVGNDPRKNAPDHRQKALF
jgi:hypothetical protein